MTPITKETCVNCGNVHEVAMAIVGDFRYARITSSLVFRYGAEPEIILETVCVPCAAEAYKAFSDALRKTKDEAVAARG